MASHGHVPIRYEEEVCNVTHAIGSLPVGQRSYRIGNMAAPWSTSIVGPDFEATRVPGLEYCYLDMGSLFSFGYLGV